MIPMRSCFMTESAERSQPDTTPKSRPAVNFKLLPAELRLKIWSCSVEPRILIFDELVHKDRSYPLPTVVQLNAEARVECRHGYEPTCRGSYFNFSRDILVCSPGLFDKSPGKSLEELTSRVQRLAFWDCFPDDQRVDDPELYEDYRSECYGEGGPGRIKFDQFFFPNVKDLWIVKIRGVDRQWRTDADWPEEGSLRETARRFRYWVDENIIETAPLDVDDPDTIAVLREGRCENKNCRDIYQDFNKMVSQVAFVHGKYRRVEDDIPWERISEDVEDDEDGVATENWMRWLMVERTMTFSMQFQWESLDEPSLETGVYAHDQVWLEGQS